MAVDTGTVVEGWLCLAASMGERDVVAGFMSPSILFLSTWDKPERDYARILLEKAKRAGYTKYHEPSVGAFAMPLIARDAGWSPQSMSLSDTHLFSSVLGDVYAGGDLSSLDVRLDGEPFEFEYADPLDRAAELILAQYRLRLEKRGEGAYWQLLVEDVRENAEEHRQFIRSKVQEQLSRLNGVKYRPRAMWDHLAEAAEDPEALIISNPPTYKCLHVDERILTADMRWVKAGSVRVGQEVVGFDEEPDAAGVRRCVRAVVTHADTVFKECVAVELADGSRVVCTVDHPWLVDLDVDDDEGREWVEAQDLRGPGAPKRYALKVYRTWLDQTGGDGRWAEGQQLSVVGKSMVMSVEPVGVQPVRSIETSSRTYVGEGWAMHNSAYEKFFDTGGRLEWAQPDYEVFDAAVDIPRMVEELEGKPALLVVQQQQTPRNSAHEDPPYARQLSAGQLVYLNSNRPDEVRSWMGGNRVVPRVLPPFGKKPYPELPVDYEITAESTVQLVWIETRYAEAYKNEWVHRITTAPGSQNVLMLIDGYAAGVIGYSLATIQSPYDATWKNHAMLRFAFGAKHEKYRLTRLTTLFAVKCSTLWLTASPKSSMAVGMSEGVVTVEMTRHPEAKGLRGIMKLHNRVKHPDGYKLTYATDWSPESSEAETLAEWLAKEEEWLAKRKK